MTYPYAPFGANTANGLPDLCATQPAEKTYRQITMEEAITMMEEETGYLILDVRTAQEYSEKHIPGAINIANESIGTEDISDCRIKIS